jgi:hypothetical protein
VDLDSGCLRIGKSFALEPLSILTAREISDHSIGRRGANRELYEFMTDFLVEKWGKGGRRRGW